MNIQSINDLFNANKWFEAPSPMNLNSASYRSMALPGKYFKYSDYESSLIAFNKCPPVHAIATMQASSYINGKTWIMNTQGKEAQSPEAKRVRQLFTAPNPVTSWKRMEAELYIDVLLWGFAVVLPIKPAGFSDNIETYQMWRIPPNMVRFEEAQTLFYESAGNIINKIFITYKGKEVELKNMQDVLILRDTIPTYTSVVIPQSRLRSLEYPINNVMGAYESRNILIANRGPMYVISSKASDADGPKALTASEVKEAKEAFKRNYGLMDGQSSAIIMSASAELKTVGFDMNELRLHEETQQSAIAICNGLDHPPFLLGLTDSTYNNQNDARKGLYENTIIPRSESLYEQWSQWLNVAEYNIVLEKDYKHLAILQEDALDMAAARFKRDTAFIIEFQNNCLTLNRWLALNNEDAMQMVDVNGAMMDIGSMYYFQLLKIGVTFGTAKPIQNEPTESDSGGSKAKN